MTRWIFTPVTAVHFRRGTPFVRGLLLSELVADDSAPGWSGVAAVLVGTVHLLLGLGCFRIVFAHEDIAFKNDWLRKINPCSEFVAAFDVWLRSRGIALANPSRSWTNTASDALFREMGCSLFRCAVRWTREELRRMRHVCLAEGHP